MIVMRVQEREFIIIIFICNVMYVIFICVSYNSVNLVICAFKDEKLQPLGHGYAICSNCIERIGI